MDWFKVATLVIGTASLSVTVYGFLVNHREPPYKGKHRRKPPRKGRSH